MSRCSLVATFNIAWCFRSLHSGSKISVRLFRPFSGNCNSKTNCSLTWGSPTDKSGFSIVPSIFCRSINAWFSICCSVGSVCGLRHMIFRLQSLDRSCMCCSHNWVGLPGELCVNIIAIISLSWCPVFQVAALFKLNDNADNPVRDQVCLPLPKMDHIGFHQLFQDKQTMLDPEHDKAKAKGDRVLHA